MEKLDFEKSYSYFQPNFVDFYDQMVDTCFGGIHSDDMEYLFFVFNQERSGIPHGKPFRSVDLGTGTGRCILGLLNRLPDDNLQELQFVGVDNSEVMVRKGLENIKRFEEVTPKVGVRVELRLGWLQDWDIPLWHNGVDLVIAAAGPFHHLLDEEAVIQSLKQIRTHLKAKGQGLAVINLLSAEDLFHRDVNSKEQDCSNGLSEDLFKVNLYRRWRTHYEISVVDGARVLHEKFRLTRVCASDENVVEWEQCEEWKLRELSRNRLVELAVMAGLREQKTYGSFGDHLAVSSSYVFFRRPMHDE